MSNLPTSKIISTLELMRTTGISDPIQIISLAESLLETGYLKSNSHEIDDLLEQIAMAALEIGGQEELSSICIQRLESRFPKSERVSLLHGMAFESRGEMSSARAHYEDILEKDESRIDIRKRLIAINLHAPPLPTTATNSKNQISTTILPLNQEAGLRMLIEHLDTVYSDPDGWLQLSQVYCSMKLYEKALTAISHAIILVPQNPYYLFRHAEIAYTLESFELAYEEFLRVVEMSEVVNEEQFGLRAALGAKSCLSKLNPTATTKKIDLLLTDLISKAQPNKNMDYQPFSA